MNGNRSEPQPLSAGMYLGVSAIGLVLVVGLMLFFVYKAPDLARDHISNSVFYVLLVPLGLSSAAFCFGAMKAYASYRAKVFGGVLELGGPVVVAALVVVGGFRLVPQETLPSKPFSVTVRFVHENKKPVSGGKVTLFLRNETRTQDVDNRGESVFSEIPSEFLRKSGIEITYEGPEDELQTTIPLDPESPPKLQVKAKPHHPSGDQTKVVFSNLTSAIGTGYVVGLYPETSNTFEIGYRFAVPAASNLVFTGGIYLASFTLGVNAVNLILRSDSDHKPGPVIETILLASVLKPTEDFIRFTSAIHPTLMAGQQYWLTASMPSASSRSLWHLPDPQSGLPGTEADRINGGSWTLHPLPQAGFEIFGAPQQ